MNCKNINIQAQIGIWCEIKFLELRYDPKQPRNRRGQWCSIEGESVSGYEVHDIKKRYSNGGGGFFEKSIDKSGESVYNKINEEIKNNPLIEDSIGTAEKPVPVKIESYHRHALKRMKERNISEDEAQGYVDNSLLAFNQNNVKAFYSESGASVVRNNDKQLITLFSKSDYDNQAEEIIKVAKKNGL